MTRNTSGKGNQLDSAPPKTKKTLDSNDQNQVADLRFSLKQWFAGGAQSRGLRKPGCGHCYLRFFLRLSLVVTARFEPGAFAC